MLSFSVRSRFCVFFSLVGFVCLSVPYPNHHKSENQEEIIAFYLAIVNKCVFNV